MEIGLDYMQMRSRAQYYGLRWAGIALLVAGALLLVAAMSYYGNLYWLRSNLDDYVAKLPGATQLAAAEAAPTPQDGEIVSQLALEPGAFADAMATLEFAPLAQSDSHPLGTLPPAQRVMVPELGINVKTDQSTLTGAAIVAHSNGIESDGTDLLRANPGERGAMWFFGEGGQGSSSFSGLTKAPELLSEGKDILIFVDNGARIFVYAATHTDVFRASDLRMSGAERSSIHLTVPVPSGIFDHFLVLSGELVGVK